MYNVCWERKDEPFTQGESDPMPLNEAIELLGEKAKELSNTGGFNWIQIEPAD